MLKKALISISLAAVLTWAAAVVLSHKAPSFLRGAIEHSLNKSVTIRDIEYHFPASFDLDGVEIKEKTGRMKGETAFAVDHMSLNVSLVGIFRRTLVIDEIRVENALVAVRKFDGRLIDVFSDVTPPASGEAKAGVSAPSAPSAVIPVIIRDFQLENGQFRFIDYDVDASGFVVAFDSIHARLRDISVPSAGRQTRYEVTARLPQGRDQEAGKLDLSGGTRFSDLETDARLDLSGVYLPYFRPYYSQVLGAEIGEGTMDSRTALKIADKNLTATSDFEIVGLLFKNYEDGDSLFGLRADELLSFLKDSSGHLKFQAVAAWNLDDPNVRAKDVIRQSISRSLKATVLGNVGNILKNVAKKYGDEKAVPDQKSDKVEQAIDKIKDILGR